jgi:rhamnosyl/mannosyltransferase
LRKRILVLGKGYRPDTGGIEIHVAELCDILAQDHDVTCVVHADGRGTVEEQQNGVRVIRAGTIARMMSQPISIDLFRLVQSFAPDLLHVHAPNVLATLASFRVPATTPVIVTHHADIMGREPIRSLVMMPYRRLLNRAARVVFTAATNRRYSRDAPNVPDHKARIVPLHADLSLYLSDPTVLTEAHAWREAYVPQNSVLASFTGRIVPYKGLDVLIGALIYAPEIRVVIIGSGPARATLEERALSLGVADRVIWAGPLGERDKNVILAASDLFVLPSVTEAEAFGISQIEAMFWGKPVVTTNLRSGVPEVGEPSVTSLIVRPGDPAELAKALRDLAGDALRRETMGRAGRERALRLYSRDAFAANIRSLYNEVLGA